jgi:hypothetical protein
MVSASSIRTKLQNKIFTPYGKSVTLKSQSSPVYNTRGEQESVTQTTTTITVVPYNIIANRRSYEPFGDLDSGDLEMAVPYSVSIALKDIITMDGTDYVVSQVEKNYLPDNVVTIVRVSKVVA